MDGIESVLILRPGEEMCSSPGQELLGAVGGELLNNMPDQLFRRYFAPNSTGAADTTEKGGNTGGARPVIPQSVRPIRNSDGSDVPGLAAQVYDCPMFLALLEVAKDRAGDFVAAKSARERQGKQCPIAFALHVLSIRGLPERLRLVGCQPVAKPVAN
jgi:hypothetical protein